MDRAVYDRIRVLEGTHWWFTARREILFRTLSKLRLPQAATILEVGCGTGGNIHLLQQCGQVWALEPDEPSRRFVFERTGVMPEAGHLPEELPWAPETFDLVCAFDVIEHVERDAEAILALAALIKPGGVLLTTVPAYPWMFGPHDAAHHHQRRYDLKPYLSLIADAGCTIERASFFNTLLFPLVLTQRLLKKALRIRTEDDVMPAAWLNRALAGIFAFEGLLLEWVRLPFGLSILVAARKATAFDDSRTRSAEGARIN